MSNRSRAQQERRNRERASSDAMAAASAVPDDAQVAFEPDPEYSAPVATPEPDARRDDDPPPRQFKVGNEERANAMDELVKARQERETVAAEGAPAAEPSLAPEPAAEPAAPAAPEMVRVKIDGEESEVSKADVDALGGVNAYQIHKAAEKRLEKAKEAEKRIAALLQQVEQRAKPPTPVEPPRKPEDLIREAVSKIQVSTPEEGAQALAGVLESMIPRIDPQQMAYQSMVLMRATEAEDRFVREQTELVQNPLLKQLVIAEKQRRLTEYQQRQELPSDWNQFYSDIARDIRAAIGRPATTPAPSAQTPSQPTSGSAEKEARKASITALPTASQRASLPEEQKPPTRDDLLNQMRKARGQPV